MVTTHDGRACKPQQIATRLCMRKQGCTQVLVSIRDCLCGHKPAGQMLLAMQRGPSCSTSSWLMSQATASAANLALSWLDKHNMHHNYSSQRLYDKPVLVLPSPIPPKPTSGKWFTLHTIKPEVHAHPTKGKTICHPDLDTHCPGFVPAFGHLYSQSAKYNPTPTQQSHCQLPHC
jgi:hypothetical protein